MKNHHRKVGRRRSGFTLVELVVVVLVLGIIASIASPKMFDTASEARENGTIQSLSVLRDAIELHKARFGVYPGNAGTEADFKADLDAFIKGAFPKNQISDASNDASVTVVTSGNPLSASGVSDWKYDNQTGELIINLAAYQNL
jgi:general secretion pathway protein G